MNDKTPTTYRVPLDSLNTSGAEFFSNLNGVTFKMPVEDWVKLGRPGEIYVTPVKASEVLS